MAAMLGAEVFCWGGVVAVVDVWLVLLLGRSMGRARGCWCCR